MSIPVIDLFAGPGGLGEGFSSLFKNDKRKFEIKLSIEKDINAHLTLELRSFTRQFPPNELPNEYYNLLSEPNLVNRTILREKLFESYPEQAEIARNEAWLAELGAPEFSSDLIDNKIAEQLKGEKNWVLIGGPPCQAYSLVGRSRRQEKVELNSEDNRVFLYKEYLRIIAMHQPAVFVMENVKGLLSAKVGEENVFNWILDDLKKPSNAFPETDSASYKIFSLAVEPNHFDKFGNPIYLKSSDYLIKSEDFGVPQKRHRVILLGIREDININPNILRPLGHEVTLKEVIGDLPKLRSGISKSINKTVTIEGKRKRIYNKIKDSEENWNKYITKFKNEIVTWNGFSKEYACQSFSPVYSTGSEYIPFKTPSKNNPLYDWYNDSKLKGVCNHESRAHLLEDLLRYQFSSIFTATYKRFPRLEEYSKHSNKLMPDHSNAESGKFNDRFRTQLAGIPATTVTCHISKDGHYFIHYDSDQCRSWTVREAARVQTFPDNYLFCGSRTAQFHQVGNAVPPYLAKQIAEIVHEIMIKDKLHDDKF